MDSKREAYLIYAEMKSIEMQKWERDYREKILKILRAQNIALTLENIPEIVDAASFTQLSKNPENSGHCPCYSGENPSPCHANFKDLNCFLCSCPSYDSGFTQIEENHELKIKIGRCKSNSKRGKYFTPPQLSGIGLWDCSDCSAYHHPQAVAKFLKEHMEELQK